MKYVLKLTIYLLLSFVIIACGGQKAEKKTKLEREPLMTIIKKTVDSLAKKLNKNDTISHSDALKLLWAGNGVIKTKTVKTKKGTRKIYTLTHPFCFTNMIDLYYIDKEAVYYYNYKKNSLDTIKKGNYLKKMKIAKKFGYSAPAYILLGNSTSKKRLFKGINRYKHKFKKADIETLKNRINAYSDECIKMALLELGAAAQNIMLLANAYNFSYYPISLQSVSNKIKKDLKIKKKSLNLFMAIPIGSRKGRNGNSSHVSYITNLLKSAKSTKPKKYTPKVSSKRAIRKLLEAGNGKIKLKNHRRSFLSHSGLSGSLIELYYLNNRNVYKYSPADNTLLNKKYLDARIHLNPAFKDKYLKVYDVIIIAVKSSKVRFSRKVNSITASKKSIKEYNKIILSQHRRNDMALFQVGTSLQNIRLMTAELDLAYQQIEVKPDNREELGKALYMDQGDLPVFIIPISSKNSDKAKK